MIRTAIISVTASFLLFGAWAVNLVSRKIVDIITKQEAGQ